MNDQSPTTPDRADLVEALLTRRAPIAEILDQLAPFGCDSDEELVTLTRDHALAVLRAYTAGELTASEVTDWAKAIELREDIGREPDHEVDLNTLLFDLATPEINAPLTAETATRWIDTLAGAPSS